MFGKAHGIRVKCDGKVHVTVVLSYCRIDARMHRIKAPTLREPICYLRCVQCLHNFMLKALILHITQMKKIV